LAVNGLAPSDTKLLGSRGSALSEFSAASHPKLTVMERIVDATLIFITFSFGFSFP